MIRSQFRQVTNFAQKYAILWATALLFALLTFSTPAFATVTNLSNIIDQQSLVVIVAVFATIALIAGGFDVSLSATFILAPLVAIRMAELVPSAFIIISVGCVVGLLVGGANGVLVTKARISPFITTLGVALVAFGIAYLFSGGSILRIPDPEWRSLVTTKFLGLTTSSWVALAAIAISGLLLQRTRFGSYIYAIGGNKQAARLAGIPVDRVLITAFVLSGVAAGFAGALNSLRTLSAQASDDFSLVFTVIAAIVIGGTSISGGFGAIWRTIAGVFFIAILGNGFNLNGVDPIYQRIIEGVVILAAVSLDGWSRSRHST